MTLWRGTQFTEIGIPTTSSRIRWRTHIERYIIGSEIAGSILINYKINQQNGYRLYHASGENDSIEYEMLSYEKKILLKNVFKSKVLKLK